MEVLRRLVDPTGLRPERRPIAVLVYLVSAVGVLGVSFVSPVLPQMMEGLSLTDAQAGLVITAFTAPVVVCIPVFGWLSDRVGRRPVITGGLVVFGAAGCGIFFTDSFRSVVALRVVQGVGFSAMMPLTTALLGDLFQGEAEISAQGLRVTFISLGAAIFPVLGGTLAQVHWRLPFLLFAVAVPFGFVAYAFLPDVGAPARRDGEAPDGIRSYVRSTLAGSRDPLVGCALGVSFGRFFVRYGLWAYLPLLATQRTLSPGEVGVIIGAVGAAKMVTASQSRHALRLAEPSVLLTVGFLAGSLLAVGMSVPASFPGYLTLGVAFGSADGIVAPVQKSLVTQRVADDVRGGVVSVSSVLQNAGKTAGPAVGGVLSGLLALTDVLVVLGGIGVAISGAIFVLAGRYRHESDGARPELDGY